MRKVMKKQKPNRGWVSQPPMFDSTLKMSHKFRYVASAAGQIVVEDRELLSILASADTAVTAFSVLQSAKIRSIELWGPPPTSSSGSSTISVQFPPPNTAIAAAQAPNRVFSDTVLGSTVPAHVKALPPKGSYASMWLGASASTVIEFQLLQGTIVDIVLDLVLANGAPTYSTAITVAGATAGDLLQLPLDWTTTAHLKPVSYATA